jgi:beta-lactamase class A
MKHPSNNILAANIIKISWVVTVIAVLSIAVRLALSNTNNDIAESVLLDNQSSSILNQSIQPIETSQDNSMIATSIEQVVQQDIAKTTTLNTKTVTNTTIQDLVSQFPGTYSVAVMKLGAPESYVGYNDTTTWVSASLYKLLQSYTLLKMIEQDELSWYTPVLEEDTVSSCFDRMIRYSDNDCGIAIQDIIGNSRVNKDLSMLGLTNTDLDNLDTENQITKDKITTAKDVAKFLEVITNGSVLTADQIAPLLTVMTEQEYRQGIPSGVPTLTVADKVGFLDEYLNDAGIVFGNKGEYVVVLLSANSDWQSIADISKILINTLERD